MIVFFLNSSLVWICRVHQALASKKTDSVPTVKITVPPEKKENKQASLLSKIVIKNKPIKTEPTTKSEAPTKQKQHSDDEKEENENANKKQKTTTALPSLLSQYDSSDSE